MKRILLLGLLLIPVLVFAEMDYEVPTPYIQKAKFMLTTSTGAVHGVIMFQSEQLAYHLGTNTSYYALNNETIKIDKNKVYNLEDYQYIDWHIDIYGVPR